MHYYQEWLAQHQAAFTSPSGDHAAEALTAADHYHATGDTSLFEPVAASGQQMSWPTTCLRELVRVERGAGRYLVTMFKQQPVILLKFSDGIPHSTDAEDVSRYIMEYVRLPEVCRTEVGYLVGYASGPTEAHPGFFYANHAWQELENDLRGMRRTLEMVRAKSQKQAAHLLGLDDESLEEHLYLVQTATS